jgi:phenylalanyl-tRNA synthetase beta chain
MEKLEELAFDFGIEIEEDAENASIVFELAANRPDLLCVENLSYALRLYLGQCEPRQFKFNAPRERILVKENVLKNIYIELYAYLTQRQKQFVRTS